ncbi:kinase-like domain-containing protein [Rhizophagus irregularis DAOM 181602=DAOM 197198]|nr:kinase-like domain-containing protein [Rhizophagus irregularis DAOM 181602=DAOM 197198]
MTLFDDGTFSHKHWRVGTFSSYRFCNDSRTRLITGNASQDSGKWTSGNDDMDRFIQDEQLPIKLVFRPSKGSGLDNTVIPYGSFSDIEFIAEGDTTVT